MPGLALVNFRGFDSAVIPLASVNFFVGENSTGKSSVLSLVEILSSPNFYFSQELASEYCDFSAYEDAVSAKNPKGRMAIGYFRLGYSQTKQGTIDALAFQFFNDEGLVGIKSISYLANGYLVVADLKKSFVQYKVYKAKLEPHKTPVTTIPKLINQSFGTLRGAIVKEGRYAYNALPLPSPLITALNVLALEGIKENEGDPPVRTRVNPRLFPQPTWIAPIRAEPQVINTKNRGSYSPKGEHIPTLIRKAFGKKASPQLVKKIQDIVPNFGAQSHLYDSISVQEYGESPSSPFEVKIRFGGAEHRISNLGYGVSQSLPVLLEIATSSNGDAFIVQQPEVHLHPRAQAAFGDFFFDMAKDRDHSLHVETHSDFLIDRYRLRMKKARSRSGISSQVVFFSQDEKENNSVDVIRIKPDGSYPDDLPKKFREFFLNEELQLLSIR